MYSMESKHNSSINRKLVDHLSGFITSERLSLFDRVIQNRTRYLTVVLEDIFQPHNASAVLRTCDCFGIQDVHIIENRNVYEINPDVALGASKWINLIRHNELENNTLGTIEQLRRQGYRIVATTPHKNDCLLDDLPLDKKTALVFGTELNGLSDIALADADAFVKIPMYGFTESFNISVSASIILFHLTEKLKKSDISWSLTQDEKTSIKLEWLRTSIKRSELIEQEFLKNS